MDLIDRQAAIDALKKHEIELPVYAPRETDVFWDDAIGCCVTEIEELPSAQPKTGHWIMTHDYFTGAYESIYYVKCSCCDEDSLEEGDYCPWCGAKMIGTQESEE